MKYQFGTIKDGRRKDIFSIIIFGFPIFSWFVINFHEDMTKRVFANDADWEKVNFLYVLGFLLFTWAGK